MATPHVTRRSARRRPGPALNPTDIVERLCSTAATLSAMRGRTRTNEYGAGLLDLERALS